MVREEGRIGVKVELQMRRIPGQYYERTSQYGFDSFYAIQLKMSLPFFQSKPGGYVHRLRSVHTYYKDGKYSHTVACFWCGGTGFNDVGNEMESRPTKHGRFLADPPPGEVCCATCEGRAVGAGQLGAPVICGRPVKFQPRI